MLNVLKSCNLLDHTYGLIAHGCNAQGVMGSGVAQAVRAKYPRAYDDYHTEYVLNGHQLYTGTNIYSQVTDDLIVANCITQEFFGRDETKRYVSYDALDHCMQRLAVFTEAKDITRVGIPCIGAGLGGGDWVIIDKIISRAFGTSRKNHITVYDIEK